MPPIVLTKEQKLEIVLKRIGDYITDPIRNKRIYQSWISGDKYFYHLHETENIDKYRTYNIFFYPLHPDHWMLKIEKREVYLMDEKKELLMDFDFHGHELECVVKIMQLKKYNKIVDAIDNMCQTRLDQNPHYRTIQHQLAEEGKLQNSKEFLDKYYNEKDKKKHEVWAAKRKQWIENHPIDALYALSRRKKMLLSKGLAKPEDFGITNLPENFKIPNFEQERLNAIKETQKKREIEIKKQQEELRKNKKDEALEKIKNNEIDLSIPKEQPTDEPTYSDNKLN